MTNIVYQIIIQPIYMVMEFFYKFFHQATGYDIILTIILLSFMVSAMCLPLYLRADAISEEISEIKKKLEPRVKSIKKNFKGDERQFLLQTYYRQNHYHPIMDLRSSFSLLLQIPFFFGAYCFFKHLNLDDNYILALGTTLAHPDEMFSIGNFSINMLPIIMTLVNLFAGFVYVKKGSTFKDHINLYVIALVFLVLLYNQPSGLVLYWLFNNVFSLIKNLLMKFMTSKSLLKYTAIFTILIFYLAYRNFNFGLDVLVIFAVLYFLTKLKFKYKFDFDVEKFFFISCAAFLVLTGLFVPSSVIASAPIEFFSNTVHPVQIIIYPFLNAFGIFLFWGGVLWMLADEKSKKLLNVLSVFLLFFAVLNIFFAPIPKATLLNTLVFDSDELSFYFSNMADKIKYFILLFMGFSALITFILKNKSGIVRKFILGMTLTGIVISGVNVYGICNSVTEFKQSKKSMQSPLQRRCLHLSKTKKNVIVIFIDRAVSSFFPELLKVKPELNEKYSGFTYYPNTLSFYYATVFGYPPIMGGYEYVPIEMYKSNDKYEDSYNKAVSVLPLIFKNEGWDVTVTDLPWFDYYQKFIQPEKVFTQNGIKYEPIRTKYSDFFESLYNGLDKEETFILAKRNFIFYSISMMTPCNVRKYIYDKGKYFNSVKIVSEQNKEFMSNYAELKYLSNLTDFGSDENTMLVFNNDLTHTGKKINHFGQSSSSSDFSKEDVPTEFIDTAYSSIYYTFSASIIMLGDFFDYLKQNNAYDNSRIIIVSDHGTQVNNPNINDKFFNNHIVRYNPLLLVKDFNDKGSIKTSTVLMTNADTPILASKSIIANPKNPYTNKYLSSHMKDNGIYVMQFDSEWQPRLYLGKTKFLNDTKRFSFVKNDIMNKKNWEIDIPFSQVKIKEGIK